MFRKYYINRKKTPKEQLNVFKILQEKETKIEIITLTNHLNHRENSEWQIQLQNIMKSKLNYFLLELYIPSDFTGVG